MRKKLIITADDFGNSLEANASILILVKLNKIDRVSVLINEHFSKKDIADLIKTGVKLDIHLDLPPDIKINNLSCGESAIKRSVLFVANYFSRKISAQIIENEWTRQIEKFEEVIGKKPDGINSHQHIHYFSPYFKIALKLARKHHINYIRFGKINLLRSNTNIYRILYFFQKINKQIFDTYNQSSSDYMISLDWISNISKFISDIPEGKTELVCHPERKDEFDLIKTQF